MSLPEEPNTMLFPTPLVWFGSILLTIFLTLPSAKEVAKREALEQAVDQLRFEKRMAGNCASPD